jgi:threonyl-tRNA synthetase
MAATLTVRLPDGSSKSLDQGATGEDLAKAIGPRLAKAALAIEVTGTLHDLSTPLADGVSASIVVPESPQGVELLRHSTAHVMAQAVLRLWPGARFAIGPVIADGFYYDFELPQGAHFSDDDLARVEEEMRAIIKENQPFVREECSPEVGLSLFASQPYKREIIEAVTAGGTEVDAAPVDGGEVVVSIYRNSETFTDLCRGPHVPATGRLGHFRLMRVAGAYWRGDEKRPQLQRIYGTAFASEKELEDHLHRLAEAERRDHRRLGAELDLFSFPEEVGPGLALFHPKGGIVRREMEEYSRRRHEQGGYEFVYSPHITKADLFAISGHLQSFADGMFPPMELDNAEYYLKPMNCPFHILIYRSSQRSYRDLPLRFFEFGTVYRYEKSGVVHGLTRVRGMTQDDAHIFCTKEQMAEELDRVVRFVLDLLRDYGLDDFYLELSTKPAGKAVGTDEEWEEATEVLRSVASAQGLELVLDEGGGAFYGPKISVQARDAIGRSWQMSTVQLDFQLPQRFGLEYNGSDNIKHRPVMIHRALFGTVERFFAILLEHYAGAFPTWLAPVQVRVLPVRDDHVAYCEKVRAALAGANVRVDSEDANEPLGTRIRRAKLERLPYILVVGDDDVANETVGVNRRGQADPERGIKVATFLNEVLADIADRRRSNVAEAH